MTALRNSRISQKVNHIMNIFALFSIEFPKRITRTNVVDKFINVEALYMLPLSSEHVTNPMAAATRIEKLCDGGAEEGGAGIVPKTLE